MSSARYVDQAYVTRPDSCIFLLCQVHGALNKHLLDANAVGGKCLDGSPAGYYYEAPPSGSDGSFWVIYLEGGGYCASKSSCTQRAGTIYGSSTNWPAIVTGEASFSSSKTENPYFWDGHHVFAPYCAGDVHSGPIATPTKETWGFYFDGHLIVKHIIADLMDKYKLNEAKNVLLTGCSAGGLGTFVNLDYVQDTLGDKVSVKGTAGDCMQILLFLCLFFLCNHQGFLSRDGSSPETARTNRMIYGRRPMIIPIGNRVQSLYIYIIFFIFIFCVFYERDSRRDSSR